VDHQEVILDQSLLLVAQVILGDTTRFIQTIQRILTVLINIPEKT